MKIVWRGKVKGVRHAKIKHGFWPFVWHKWYFHDVEWRHIDSCEPADNINKFFKKKARKERAKELIQIAEEALKRSKEKEKKFSDEPVNYRQPPKKV